MYGVSGGGGKGDFGVSAKFPRRLTAVGKFHFDEPFVKIASAPLSGADVASPLAPLSMVR